MEDKKLKKIIDECFWNDYSIEIEDVKKLLSENDKNFTNFFIKKIISNSSFPSARLLSIFSIEKIKEMLPESYSDKRISKRLKLVRANLLKEPIEGVRPWI